MDSKKVSEVKLQTMRKGDDLSEWSDIDAECSSYFDTPQDITCISQCLNDTLPNYLNINLTIILYILLWHATGHPG